MKVIRSGVIKDRLCGRHSSAHGFGRYLLLVMAVAVFFSKCCRDSVFIVLRHVPLDILACRWSGFAGLPPGCKAHISSQIVFRSAAICHDTVSEWLRRWTRNPLGSARVGSNPAGVACGATALMDSKSSGLSPRRLESCRCRMCALRCQLRRPWRNAHGTPDFCALIAQLVRAFG